MSIQVRLPRAMSMLDFVKHLKSKGGLTHNTWYEEELRGHSLAMLMVRVKNGGRQMAICIQLPGMSEDERAEFVWSHTHEVPFVFSDDYEVPTVLKLLPVGVLPDQFKKQAVAAAEEFASKLR